MSLNWKEIDLILSELPLIGSHIQKIEQPDFSSLVLHCYSPGRRFALLISLAQGGSRFHISSARRKKSTSLQRFAQLLRSRINGGRIYAAGQLGSERIVRIGINRAGEDTLLYLRLWGGAGNILACESDGTILDAFYRRPGRMETSGERFDPDKLIRAAREKNEKSGTSGNKPEFAVRPYRDDGEAYPFNRFIESFYDLKEEREKRIGLEKQARIILDKRISHLSSVIERLEENLDVSMASEKLKEYGDLIMSNQHLVLPGAPKLQCSNYYREGETVEIPLNPRLSAAANGEAYYHRYKKEKRKREYLEQDIASAYAELERYTDLSDLLSGIESDRELISLLETFLDQEKSRGGAAGSENDDQQPGLRFVSGDFSIIAGRNARENDRILRTLVKGNDYWLHARDYPGGYVFIKNRPGKSVPLEVLLDAGNLALFFSRGRSGGKGELYYTRVKYLRRAKNAKTGTVLPTMEKNLSIVLDRSRLDRLLGKKERS
jgi:predicted ribosome quality control (RQC) complex YloA/Tae2 family protein